MHLHFFHEIAIFWTAKKTMQRHFFFNPPSPFPGNFSNCNNGGICTASQTACSNAYTEIGPEVMLQPLVTSCAKDYKGHSLVQTSFTEPPNTQSP